jgi:hypothetical protein
VEEDGGEPGRDDDAEGDDHGDRGAEDGEPGDDGPGREETDGHDCGPEALEPGVVVHEAKLRLTSSGLVWREVELVGSPS